MNLSGRQYNRGLSAPPGADGYADGPASQDLDDHGPTMRSFQELRPVISSWPSVRAGFRYCISAEVSGRWSYTPPAMGPTCNAICNPQPSSVFIRAVA